MTTDKGFPLPDPIGGYPLICVTMKIPDDPTYRRDFLGHMWQLGKWWNWQQSGIPGDTRAKEAAQLWRDLLYDYLRIEECPDVCCCPPPPSFTDRMNAINYNNTTTTTYQTTQNTWNAGGQTVSSVAPNLDWDTGDPVNISKLTCSAIRALMASIVAQGKQMNTQTAQQNQDTVNTISAGLAGLSAAGGAAAIAGGGAAAVVGFFGGPYLVLGLALGAVGAKVATLFMGAEPSLFDDTEALENVICTIINNTNDGSMTRTKFEYSLVPNDFTSGSPEEQLAQMIQPYLSDLTVYLQFMATGNSLYEISDFAALPECGCEPDFECWDFETGQHGWVGVDYHPGQGYGRAESIGAPGRIVLSKDLGTRLVRKYQVHFNEDLPSWTDVRNIDNGAVYRRNTDGTLIREMVFDPPLSMRLTNIDNGNDGYDIGPTTRVKKVCIQYASEGLGARQAPPPEPEAPLPYTELPGGLRVYEPGL